MASNTQINVVQNSNQIQLHMKGDFDGSVAMQLLHLLKSNYRKNKKIIIHTDDVHQIYPFGVKVFSRQMKIAGISTSQYGFIGSRSRDFEYE